MEYIIIVTDDQDAALNKIASDLNKTAQEIIDEQVSYYIKTMLTAEAKKQKLLSDEDLDELTDAQQADLLAIVLNAKDAYLDSIK